MDLRSKIAVIVITRYSLLDVISERKQTFVYQTRSFRHTLYPVGAKKTGMKT